MNIATAPNSSIIHIPQRSQGQIPQDPSTEPVDRVERGIVFEAASRTIGVASGIALTFNRMIVGGCAGAGQGIVKATGLKDDQADLGFKVAMTANLAATGALAGGFGYEALALSPAQGAAAGAVTNALIGNQDWKSAAPAFQNQVRTTADEWVEASLAKLPEPISQGQGVAANVARGLVGEVVGLSAGVFASSAVAPQSFQAGYDWGTRNVERLANWMSPASDENKA
ncbi:MAG: hypothetical protein AMXMBFR33_66390 [Candidatus Xenobia bacterium]|jgi:hypothetical protein